MNTELIEQFASPEFFRQMQDVRTGLRETLGDYVALSQKVEQAEQSLKSNSSTLKGLADAQKQLAAAQLQLADGGERLSTERTAYMKLEAEAREIMARAGVAEANQRTANARAMTSEARAERVVIDLRNNSTRAINASANAYQRANKEHQALKKEAQALGIVFGIESKQFQEAAKRANELDARLKGVDSALGDNRRKVGEYENATKGLSGTLTKFTGILRNSGNEIDSLARIFGFSKATADDFRIALEHTSKTLAGFFAIFDKVSAKKGAQTAVEDLTKAERGYEAVIDSETAALNSNVLARSTKITQDRTYTVVKAQNTVATAAHRAVLTAEAAATAASTLATNAKMVSMHGNVAAYTVLNREGATYRVITAQNALTTRANAAALGQAAAGQGTLATATTATTIATRALSVALIATGLVALIAVLAVLAVKYYQWQESIKETKLAQETLKAALDNTDYKKAIQNVSELRENVKLAKEGMLDKNAVVEQYNKTMGEAAGKVSSLAEVEKALADKADAYIRMTLQKAAATEAFQQAAEESVKAQKALIDIEEGGNPGVLDYLTAMAPGGVGIRDPRLVAMMRLTDEGMKAQKKQEQLLRIADKFSKNQAQIAKNFGLDPLGNGNVQSGSLEALRKQISTLEEYESIQAAGSVQQIAAAKQLVDLRKQFKNLQEGRAATPVKGSGDALREEIKALEEKIGIEAEGSKEQIQDTRKLIALRERLKKIDGRESAPKKNSKGSALQEFTGIKELNDARAALAQQRVEQDMGANRLVFENERNSLEDRLSAYQKFSANRIYIAGLTRDKEVANAKAEKEAVDKALADGTKRTAPEISGLTSRREAAEVKIRQATEKYQAEQVNITADAQKAITGIYETEVQKRLQAMQQVSDSVDAERKADLDVIKQQLEAGTITLAQYKGKEEVINEESRLKELGRQKSYLQRQIDNVAAAGGDTTKIQDQLNKTIGDLYQADHDEFVKWQQKKADAVRELHDLQKQLAGEAAQFLQTLFSTQAEKQISDLDKVIEGINAQKDADISRMEQTSEYYQLTEEQKAARKAGIENKALADRKAVEAEQDKIRQRNAQFNKLISVAQVVGQTAQTIAALAGKEAEAQAAAAVALSSPFTAAYAPVAAGAAASIAAQIPIIAGISAVQIGTILAAPAYAEGTDFHPGGPAYMFEGNRLELVQEKGKAPWIGSQEGYYDLSRGATVTPLGKLGLPDTAAAFQSHLLAQAQAATLGLPQELAAAQAMAISVQTSHNVEQTAQLVAGLKAVQKAVNNKQTAVFNFENLGIKNLYQAGNSRGRQLQAFDC
jgi:hypothetical protein